MSRYPSGATSCVVADAGFFSNRFRFLLDPLDSTSPGSAYADTESFDEPRCSLRNAATQGAGAR